MLNLLKAVSATDDLTNLGDRILVFEDDSSGIKEITIVPFPEHRGTLLYRDKLYDWYGREVAINPRIKRIVRPFGYSYDSSHNPSRQSDNFLVELGSGKLAIVEVQYRQSESPDSHYIGTKLRATGQTLDALPYLSIDDSVPIYESIDDSFVKNTCLRDLQHSDNYPLVAIGQVIGSEQYVFLSDHVFRSYSSRGWFVHHVVQSKRALIDLFTSPEQKWKKATHPPTIFSTTSLCSSLFSSEDGDKITAEFSYPTYHSSNLHASLDRETLTFCKDNCLYWYEEHEP